MNKKASLLMGVDIGSGSLKSIVITSDGKLIASENKELLTKYSHPGWSEQDPQNWYLAFCETVKKIFLKTNIKKAQIASICICSTPHTAVLLGRNDDVLRPSILWTDQRSKKEVDWLNNKYAKKILNITYNRASPTWTLPQILWIKNNEPNVIRKTEKLMIAKDYLRYRLTEEWVTDNIDAMGTLLFDVKNVRWSEELCSFTGLPITSFPRIVSPKTVVGKINKRAAADSGLLEGTPVVAGSTDTAVEAFGTGAINAGQGIVKLATAGNVNIVSGTPHPHPLLFNYFHLVPGKWYTLTGTNSCASAHKWLRDRLFFFEKKRNSAELKAFDIMDKLAKEVPAGSDGLIFHPYLLGERTPYYDPFLRADFIGITMRHNNAHFVRALYEGIAFSLRDCYKLLIKKGLKMEEVRIIGGGSKSWLWTQIVSDVLGVEVLRPAVSDAAYGAAILGGVGVGIFEDENSAVRCCVKIIGSQKPSAKAQKKYFKLFEIYKKSQKRLAEINHELNELE